MSESLQETWCGIGRSPWSLSVYERPFITGRSGSIARYSDTGLEFLCSRCCRREVALGERRNRALPVASRSPRRPFRESLHPANYALTWIACKKRSTRCTLIRLYAILPIIHIRKDMIYA